MRCKRERMNQWVPHFSPLCRHSAGESFRSWYRCENVLFLCLWMNAFTFSISLCLLTLTHTTLLFCDWGDPLWPGSWSSLHLPRWNRCNQVASEWMSDCCHLLPEWGRPPDCTTTRTRGLADRLIKNSVRVKEEPRVNSVCVSAGGSWATFQFTTGARGNIAADSGN